MSPSARIAAKHHGGVIDHIRVLLYQVSWIMIDRPIHAEALVSAARGDLIDCNHFFCMPVAAHLRERRGCACIGRSLEGWEVILAKAALRHINGVVIAAAFG